jgi:hypothetical protein
MPPKQVPKWKRDSKKTGVSPKELEWEQKEQEANLQVLQEPCAAPDQHTGPDCCARSAGKL